MIFFVCGLDLALFYERKKGCLDANHTDIVVSVSFLDDLVELNELLSERMLVREEVRELKVFNFLVASIGHKEDGGVFGNFAREKIWICDNDSFLGLFDQGISKGSGNR